MVITRKFALPLSIAAGTYACVIRPHLLHWGATDQEVRGPFPGADLIPGGSRSATMAVTLDAPPDRVWPWLVQMGADRAGWYSWDHLDNWGHPSDTRIHPEWQAIKVGDTPVGHARREPRVGSRSTGAGAFPGFAHVSRPARSPVRP